MSTHRTMSPEMDAWLEQREANLREGQQAMEVMAKNEASISRSPEWTHTVALNTAQWVWLFKKYQKVSTPMLGFARRMQTTVGNPETMSKEQVRWLLALAYKYRRQIFSPTNKSAKLTEAEFVEQVRRKA